MNDPAPERFSFTFILSPNDYANYAEAIARRPRSWSEFYAWLVVVFSAIPAALLCRWLATRWLDHADAVELIGRFSLLAYALGIIAYRIAVEVMTHRARTRYAKTIDAPRTVEINGGGVTSSSEAAQCKWQWAAFNRCTFQRGFVLIWIGDASAVPIPARCFDGEAARGAALAFIRARMAEARAST